MILPSRRLFLTGLTSTLAAPAIVRIESLMSVRGPKLVAATEEEILAIWNRRVDAFYKLLREQMSENLYASSLSGDKWEGIYGGLAQ